MERILTILLAIQKSGNTQLLVSTISPHLK